MLKLSSIEMLQVGIVKKRAGKPRHIHGCGNNNEANNADKRVCIRLAVAFHPTFPHAKGFTQPNATENDNQYHSRRRRLVHPLAPVMVSDQEGQLEGLLFVQTWVTEAGVVG